MKSFLESQTQEDSFVHKLLGDKFENAISVIADGIKKVIPDVNEDEVRVNTTCIIFFHKSLSIGGFYFCALWA